MSARRRLQRTKVEASSELPDEALAEFREMSSRHTRAWVAFINRWPNYRVTAAYMFLGEAIGVADMMGADAEKLLRMDRLVSTRRIDRHAPSRPHAPGRERLLLENPRHPINQPDAPSFTVTCKGDGRGAQGACVVSWPWDRPSTTVTTRDTIAPPGHHPESGSVLSMPNAVVLSQLAATILQGFPESWHLAGKTKKARWSQLGQAMPPALAEAVARAVVAQRAWKERAA